MTRPILLIFALIAGFAFPACKSVPDAEFDEAAWRYRSIERVLQQSENSLWASGTDLPKDLVSVHAQEELVAAPDPLAGRKHFGFFNGQPSRNKRITALSIDLRGKHFVIPGRYWSDPDLYNLWWKDRMYLGFGSGGGYGFDVIRIMGAESDRGYDLIFLFENGEYLGRRISIRGWANYDDFKGGPVGETRVK